MPQTSLFFNSKEARIAGTLFVPESPAASTSPALLVCHGAGDFKENFYELAEFLSANGIASLCIDMHGHGESEGDRFAVRMSEWTADISAAIDFLLSQPTINPDDIHGFGFSSGGTALVEFAASAQDQKMKSLILLDATVRDLFNPTERLLMKTAVLFARIKKSITGTDLKLNLKALEFFSGKSKLAASQELNKQIEQDERFNAALRSFPLPGGSEAFFTDAIKCVPRIRIPTLVLWGGEDRIDPPETAQILFDALTVSKQLQVIPGNGHAGHLDMNKERVFQHTLTWLKKI
ncbi:MAG TPA: alpha/beta hydrolase [Candidatus Paceibacterota bacterium]